MKYVLKTATGSIKVYGGPVGVTVTIADGDKPEVDATVEGLGSFDELFGALAEARRALVANVRDRQGLATVPPVPFPALLESSQPRASSREPRPETEFKGGRVEVHAAELAEPQSHDTAWLPILMVEAEHSSPVSYVEALVGKYTSDEVETDGLLTEVILLAALREAMLMASQAVVLGCPTRARTGAPCASCAGAAARIERLGQPMDQEHDAGT